MTIPLEKLATSVVIRPEGRIDSRNAELLREAFDSALQTNGFRIIADLEKADYISSAGLRYFLTAWKKAREQDRFLELINSSETIRKALTVVGLGELMPLGNGTMKIIDILKQQNSLNEQALGSARGFLNELLRVLGVRTEEAQKAVENVFRIIRELNNMEKIEQALKKELHDLKLGERIAQSLGERAALICRQIRDMVGEGSILDVGCGDGKVAAAFQTNGRSINLIDVVNYNATDLPFKLYDGKTIPFPDKSFDCALLITVLHHCDDPLLVLRETKRVTRKRIIVEESVYLNESNRRFNMFFDWFYNRILHDGVNVPFNFNTPEGWEQVFRSEGLTVSSSADIGLDQVTVPEYHWIYGLDLPVS